jgi:HK97 family phage prohead protease
MKNLLEYKNLSGGVQDVDTKKRVVTGYLSEFDSEDLTKDIIEPGAFTKTIAERSSQIYFLNNHNWGQPHGRFNVLREDVKGLYFESDPLIDTTYSSDLLKLYEAGIVKEHSIGYQVARKEQKGGIRHLKELRLAEGSNVTRGANPNTPFMGFKSLTQIELIDKEKLLLKAIADGTFTDATFGLLEIALKQLQTDAFELGQKTPIITAPSIVDTRFKDAPSLEILKAFNEKFKH